jgi:hypothetical protein
VYARAQLGEIGDVFGGCLAFRRRPGLPGGSGSVAAAIKGIASHSVVGSSTVPRMCTCSRAAKSGSGLRCAIPTGAPIVSDALA